MQLDEFKKNWEDRLSAENGTGLREEQMNKFMVGGFENLDKLRRTSRFWWKMAAFAISILVLLTLVTSALYFMYPERLESLRSAIPALVILPLFVGAVGVLYYQQARVFDVYNCSTLLNALHHSIIRFRNWYRLSLVVFAVVLTPVYYFLVAAVSYKLDIDLSPSYQLPVSVVLTLVTLIFNHLHYKRTYFHWVANLKKNISDID